MSLFSVYELGNLESDLEALLPPQAFSAASLYDTALANPKGVYVVVMPPSKTVQRQNAIDFIQLWFMAGDQPTVGGVVSVLGTDYTTRWYLIVKIATLSPTINQPIPILTDCIQLPYQLTATRPATVPQPQSSINIWGGPATTDANGYPTFATITSSFYAGLSNQFNPLNETLTGPLPKGSVTFYTYAGAPIQTDDQIEFDGKHYYIEQLNLVAGNGFGYGRQVILQETGGKTYP